MVKSKQKAEWDQELTALFLCSLKMLTWKFQWSYYYVNAKYDFVQLACKINVSAFTQQYVNPVYCVLYMQDSVTCILHAEWRCVALR